MNIPTIPGLAPHPRQIAEQQRLAEARAQQVAAGLEPEQPTQADASKAPSIMPSRTRETLKVLIAALRKANTEGAASRPGDGGAARLPAPVDPKEVPQPDNKPDRRATLLDTSHDDLSIPANSTSMTAPPKTSAAAVP
jgi:penicillin-binding protein 1A